MIGKRFFLLTGLAILLAFSGLVIQSASPEPEQIPLWPLLYSARRADGAVTTEMLFSAVSFRTSAKGEKSGILFPAFWGPNYFHVAPLYCHWDNNQLLLPIGWKFDQAYAVGPVWWSRDYFHIFPLYWHWHDNHLLLPLAWKIDDHMGLGPVWWGKDNFTVFPLYWQRDNTKLLFPLAYHRTAPGITDFRILWRLMSYHRDGQERTFEFQPLTVLFKRPGFPALFHSLETV